MKKEHKRKMVAPIVIICIVVIYYVSVAAVCLLIPYIPAAVKLFFTIVPLALAGVAVAVLWERMKEIRSGEEDDLSKY